MNLVEAKKFIADNDVKFILAQFVDIHGVAKTKAVPADHLEDILDVGAGFAGFAVWGLGLAPHSPDFMAKGDLSTLSLVPWQKGFARIVCDGHVQDKPWHIDTRVVLQAQREKLAALGYEMFTGLEPEFSLLKKNPDGTIAPFDDGDTLAKPCYDYKGLSAARAFVEKLVGDLKPIGYDIYQIDHEDANGQFEINYTYDECLTSADKYVFFKMAASEIAREQGLVCSFMPKPFSNRPGNGMHMHISLGPIGGKGNLFQDKSDKNGLDLSELAYHFVGGILKHAKALSAICAPSVNSYKRLVVGRSLSGATWAPAYISYGDNNRSCMVRIPGGRIEMRLADGSCNPYLAAAAVIAAGIDGIENKITPPDPINENLYDFTQEQIKDMGIETLPQNLHEALIALEQDTVLKDALGDVVDEFLKVKHMEWVEYMRHVSDWEIKSYLEFY